METTFNWVLTLCKQEFGGRAEVQVIGTYSTAENANNALDRLFHKMCDSYGVAELGEYDYYTEGDSFNLENQDTTDFVVRGWLEKCELDQDNEYE